MKRYWLIDKNITFYFDNQGDTIGIDLFRKWQKKNKAKIILQRLSQSYHTYKQINYIYFAYY